MTWWQNLINLSQCCVTKCHHEISPNAESASKAETQRGIRKGEGLARFGNKGRNVEVYKILILWTVEKTSEKGTWGKIKATDFQFWDCKSFFEVVPPVCLDLYDGLLKDFAYVQPSEPSALDGGDLEILQWATLHLLETMSLRSINWFSKCRGASEEGLEWLWMRNQDI